MDTEQNKAIEQIRTIATEHKLNVTGGKIRRSSSRFCFAVEHGDYNGTELFGVGTDRFIWMAYKPNGTNRVRLYSANFSDEGVVDFELGRIPEPLDPSVANAWARFPFGVNYILQQEGYKLKQGFDAVVYGNIPGGGMSRSASLTLNLILTMLEVNAVQVDDDFRIIDMAQAVENVYIGSPCGQLDQIMIYFAREGMGTHYNPEKRTIDYVPYGAADTTSFRIVVMDTGTDRPGLDKSTYKVRRGECDEFAAMLKKDGYDVSCLADIRDEALYEKIKAQYEQSCPHLVNRAKYIYEAQQRFYEMMEAWKKGDIETVGGLFRRDGVGLRDDYVISGPELETMCDIVRTVPGVLGERMLGGGDKGAAGAVVKADAVEAVRDAVDTGYPRSRPDYAKQYAVHVCKVVDGITVLEGLI